MTRFHCAIALALAGTAPVAAQASAPDYAIVDRIPGADGTWDYASLDTVGNRVYVARSNAVMVVDLATRKVTDALVAAQGAHSAFALPDGRTLVTTDGRSGLTRFVDAADGHSIAAVASGQKPDAAVYEPVSRRVVVMSPGSNEVVGINAASHTIAFRLTVAGGVEGAAADGKGRVFANLEARGGLVEIDAVAGKVVRTATLPGCEGPTGIALVAGGTRTLSACANGIAVVTDTANGAIVGTFPIDGGADAVLVDETRHRAFIPCGTTGTLIEIATDNPDHVRVTGRIATQIGARSGAIDPRDGRIYLPAATLGTPTPGAKRGKPIAGSFVVLVLAPRG